ncbi:MAG: ELWxxDGT repeat protein [Thermoanaerobaculia bacterium]
MIRSVWLAGGLLALLAVPAPAAGEPGPARLVADFFPGHAEAPLRARGFARVGNRSVFVRVDNEIAPALWVTDGTRAGTSGLGVLCPPCEEVDLLGSTGSIAFYRVVRYGFELGREMRIWRTDGTAAGTFPVTGPLLPLLGSRDIGRGRLYGLAGTRLFFAACTPKAGCELWSSDGSVAGTGLAGEAVAGPESSDIVELATSGGWAFLIIKDADGGTALWLADGSAGGLKRLRDVTRAGSLLAGDAGAGRVFFLAEDGAGRELWTSDGTSAGTRSVTRFAPRDPFGTEPWLRFAAGRLFFQADDGAHGFELWSLASGTGRARRITDFIEPNPWFLGVTPVADRLLLVVIRRPPGGDYTVNLWSSRGDFRSTALLAGCPGGCPVPTSTLEPVGAGRYVFAGSTAGNAGGYGFWSTDGTSAGTRLLRHTGRSYSHVQSVAVGGRVLFDATDEYETGDLWITDGTVAGTFLSGHGGPRWSHYYGWSEPLQAGAAGGRLVFQAKNGQEDHWDSWWTTDGTPAGIRLLAPDQSAKDSLPNGLAPVRDGLLFEDCASGEESELRFARGLEATLLGSRPSFGNCFGHGGPTVNLGDFAVVLAYGPDGPFLQRMDGTPAGTATLVPAAAPGAPRLLTRFGEQAAFWVVPADPRLPSELWATDGFPAGTRKLTGLPPGVDVDELTGIGDKLFFFHTEPKDNDCAWTPWVAGGAAPEALPLISGPGFLSPETSSPYFVGLGGRAFFPVARGAGPVEVWSSDGTPAGTKPAITAASRMRSPQYLTAVGGRLYFAARREGDPSGRLLPWASDGTDAGTEPLADAALKDVHFADGDDLEEGRRPRFVELDGRVYFAASDPAHGDELWKTDGTPEGTARVRDIAPGAFGSYPRGLVAWQGRLWFRARDAAHGMELWTSDGTAEGTRLVQDIAAEGSWSMPLKLTPTGTGLYFTANDGVHGRELWVVEAP